MHLPRAPTLGGAPINVTKKSMPASSENRARKQQYSHHCPSEKCWPKGHH